MLVQRAYEATGNEIVLLQNRNIRIPYQSTDDPFDLIEAHERRTWPSRNEPIEIVEYESFSGTFFPAVARPLKFDTRSIHYPFWESEIQLAKTVWREHGTIAADIENCFDVVAPDEDNFDAYGTQFEKIIYFASVGVEALFHKVLRENGIKKRNAGMKQFVKLNPFLCVDDYGLTLVHYPWISELRPFRNWDVENPSKSLSWFDAYNSLKHDKRDNQKKASMRNALQAAAAYYIASYAVFGDKLFPGYLNDTFFFHFASWPNWRAEELYFPSDDKQWKPRKISI